MISTGNIKTVVLLGALSGLLIWVGNILGGPSGMTIGLVFALVMNLGSYYFSDKMVLAMYRAKETSKSSHKELHDMVEKICKTAGIPKPRIYIVPSQNPNAFATGRNPEHAVVACTEGILRLLNKHELEGVLAHEISHIKNRDILIQTIASTIAAVISYVAMMARWAAIFGGFGSNRDRGSSGLELIFLAIITPIIAMLLQLAISRSREYQADASAARILNDSSGLSSALEKISAGGKQCPMRMGNEATSALFISNPFSMHGISSLLSTHPPLKKRLSALKHVDLKK